MKNWFVACIVISGDLVPEWVGQWRKINVRVGPREPPPSPLVPLQMHDYLLDLQARWENSSSIEHWLETLAFAEGRFLSIHPFADFNGRLVRLWLWELVRRAKIPPVNLVPAGSSTTREYLDALGSADKQDFRPLIEVWKQRLTRS